MSQDLSYLFMVVLAGWAVTFGLRALPFLLFAGSGRTIPGWVEKLGNVVSPVIIAGLIVYSYSGLEWRTAWPYLAGALTVVLHVWKRNALVSIIAGTVLYMFLVAGCTTVRELEYGVDHPLLELSVTGLKFNGEYVSPEEVPDLLEEYRIPHDAVIHIAITPEVQRDLKPVRTFMGYLAIKGYKRSVLVTGIHGDSSTRRAGEGARLRAAGSKPARKPKIRYKGANE